MDRDTIVTQFCDELDFDMNTTLITQLLAVLCLSGFLVTSAIAIFPTSAPSTEIPGTVDQDDDDPDVTRTFRRRKSNKPNIVIILADDLGWNDVSFHGSNQIPTPNIDALAYNGIILNKHYVPALCTPSRSALMTGKNPIHLGMQHSVLLPAEPRGLPLSEKLLPEYLRDVGYKNYAVGKWHLGYFKKDYLPTYRGFDSHFGYWNGLKDYYTHFSRETNPNFHHFVGYDMRRNLSVAWDAAGKYSTDLFTEEAIRLINTHDTNHPMFLYLAHLASHRGNADKLLRAPDEEIAKFSHILDPERRIHAAVVSKLDQSVGEVMDALRSRGMLENSIIIFMSDNGAPTIGFLSNSGSNYPLRGMKESPWEGGVRGAAAIWSPLIKKSKRVSNQMMFMADWLPTLLSAAGVDKRQLSGVDGFDLWPTLVSDRVSPRSEVVLNIDDISNYAAIRRGDFKYVIGQTETGGDWLGATGHSSTEGVPPEYDPNRVLHSKTGVAISGVITARQVMELRERRKRFARTDEDITLRTSFQERILSPEKIVTLRKQAQIKCNVREEDKVPCDPLKAPCLFNIEKDPCEMVNLAESRPVIMAVLERALMKYRVSVIPPSNLDTDPRADPSLWNNTWTSWEESNPLHLCYKNVNDSRAFSGPAIAVMSVIFGLFIVGVMTILALKCGKCDPSKQNPDVRKDFNRFIEPDTIDEKTLSIVQNTETKIGETD